MASEEERYRALLDGRWELSDFSDFTRLFTQLYSFAFSLSGADMESSPLRLRRDTAYRAFPWQGGYSTVNFFQLLYRITPPPLHPRVVSINYASPGWIEIAGSIGALLLLAKMLRAYVALGSDIWSLYEKVQTFLTKNKLRKISANERDLKLTPETLEVINSAIDSFSGALGLNDNPEFISLREKVHPLALLKVLLATYRRVRALREFEMQGKLLLPKR